MAGALLFRLRALVALVVLLAVFSILSPAFLTAGNLTILLKHVAINAIMAVGMTFVILSGGIDLSVGSVAGLAGMIAGGLIDRGLVLPMFGVVVYFQIWLVIRLRCRRRGGRNRQRTARLLDFPWRRSSPPWVPCTRRRGAALAAFERRHVPQPGGPPRLRNTGFLCWARGRCRAFRSPSG